MRKMILAIACLSLAGCGGGGGSSSSSTNAPNSVGSSSSSSLSSSSISSSNSSSIGVSKCEGGDGSERDFQYDWSLENQLITFTNKNECDSLFVWATSTPLCDGCINEIVDIYREVLPEETIVIEAKIPKYLSWKPEVIYSLENGETFSYHPLQAGTSTDHNFKLIILDYAENYESEIDDFKSLFLIDSDETVRGDCENFSWIDRRNGRFKIVPGIDQKTAYCFVGNIQGYNSSGDMQWLPAVRYFVTDKTKKINK